MEDFHSWQIFVAVYETGSIFDTAKKLHLENPYVSKKLRALEKSLGVTLFDRNSRPFLPTPVASELLPYAKEIVGSRGRIASLLSNRISDETQIIRLMVGNSHGKYLPKIIGNYLEENPQTRVNVISPLDLEEFKHRLADIAFVSGTHSLPNVRLESRGKMIFIPVASRRYLEEHGPIDHPKDLEKHHVYGSLYSSRYSFTVDYVLKKGSSVITLPQTQMIRWSSVEMAKQAVLQGVGISLSLAHFGCIDELESGELVPILNGWHRPSQENYVAVHNDDWHKPFIRRFGNYLAEEFSKISEACEERLRHVFPERLFNEIIR